MFQFHQESDIDFQSLLKSRWFLPVFNVANQLPTCHLPFAPLSVWWTNDKAFQKQIFLVDKGLWCPYDTQNNTWLLVEMEFFLLVFNWIFQSFAAGWYLRSLRREILFLPLEHIIYISSPPWNILYSSFQGFANFVFKRERKLSLFHLSSFNMVN